MDISLIIATRNRASQLARCLQAVKDIRFERPWELTIVDNDSSDNTADVVQKFVNEAAIPVSYVCEPVRGLSNARNAGLKAARGDILAFTDDDCYPASDFLTEIWRAFVDHPSLGYIGGRILLHDPADYRITFNESTAPRLFPKNSYLAAGDIQGANMAFRKSTLEEIGGFDPLFGAGAMFSAEDIDAAARASMKGWVGKYCPEVVVRHHHGRKAADVPGLWKSYAIGRGAYHMKLLLKSGRFMWFAKAIYRVRYRSYELSRWTIFWEQVGALGYAYMALVYFYSWFSKIIMRKIRATRC